MSAGKIQVLPDFLINQIAAGEVVENPASVVKELVENAVDAQARRIVVEIEGGGLALVRVVDDGCGMSEEDAVVAMGRHATSKIRELDDLMSIRTLGFRGEALPSIASVSRFALRTRRSVDDAGTQVDSVDGNIAVRPCACPVGTTIEVRDLFFNVPARLKFQKGEKSQVMAVSDAFRRAALANHGVHFVLRSGSRVVADYPPCARLADRAAMILGHSSGLYPFQAERQGAAVSGVLGAPDAARGDSSRTIIMVNGRPVTDVALRRIMVGVYSTLLAPGRFPVAVADIRLDPAAVDVNVHPQKHEVRFREPREVASLLYDAMSSVIDATPWIAPGAAPGVSRAGSGGGVSDAYGLSPAWAGSSAWPLDGLVRDQGAGTGATGTEETLPGLLPGRPAGLRYLGQIGNTVLVCAGEGSLVLIDQHAAHERINFNSLWSALEAGEVPSEQLLFPEIVTLDSADMDRFDAAFGALERLGFDLERYSGDSVAVRAAPVLVHGRSVDAIVREAFHVAGDAPSVSGDSVLRKIVSTVACHASVRAGDPLSDIEARTLIARMEGEAKSSYCPHGRQAVVVQPIPDILKSFDR